MLAITVQLLTGGYTATKFDDRRVAEWPPHPARLFSALVASWADADEPDANERAALAWLEGLDPPVITCDVDPGRREVVDHYVPGNDARAGGSVDAAYAKLADAVALLEAATDDRARKRTAAVAEKARARAVDDSAKAGIKAEGSADILPENRNRQARTFPTVLPESPHVTFTWLVNLEDAARLDVLDSLCARVGRLGHSSTLVACRAYVPDTAPQSDFRPAGIGDDSIDERERLRIPRAGLLDRLELAHAHHLGIEPRVLPARSADYVRGHTTRRLAPLAFAGRWTVLALPMRPGLSVRRTLDVTSAIRGALMAHGAQPAPEVLSGHVAGAPGEWTPPTMGPHLAILPLASAGHARSDGTLLGIALVLPTGCTEDDRRVVDSAVLAWQAERGLALHLGGMRAGLPMRVLGPHERGAPLTLQPERWARASATWRSVTPVVLDRSIDHVHSNDTAKRDAAAAKVAVSVAASCLRVGLAVPDRVDILHASPLVGIPSGARFPRFQASGRPLVHVHVELHFSEPVRGPVVIGAGRFRGYGLLAPIAETRGGETK